jgi:hypothetical protein
MSTGGVYQLITSTGLQDKLLSATQLLNQRLKHIEKIRCRNPAIRDTTPTLVDIERTHVLFVNAHFKPFCATAFEYQKTPLSQGIQDLGQTLTWSIPQFGDFFHDTVVHFQLTGLTAAAGDKVYYTDLLGHRLIQNVQFEVNGNFLDQYDYNVMNFHYNFFVHADKKTAWNRMVGQEVPDLAYLTNNPGVDEYREVKYIVSGPQTPKSSHPVVDLWIPLLFWFSRDPRLALPSVSVPYGQRFIHITLADAEQICASVSGGIFTAPTLLIADIYINNIFVNPEIHDIFIRRVGFSLIRVHLTQSFPEAGGSDTLQLNQFKFPVETIYLGLQPLVNLTGGDNMVDWWKYSNVTTTLIPYPVAIPSGGIPPYNLAFSQAIWRKSTPTIDTLQLTNHGVILYDQYPELFYSAYLPWNYGTNIVSPLDPGLCMMTFNLYPGIYQPSGSFNMSVARETYLNWTGSTISGVNKATMIAVAICINFLLIAEGTCVLRFSV